MPISGRAGSRRFSNHKKLTRRLEQAALHAEIVPCGCLADALAVSRGSLTALNYPMGSGTFNSNSSDRVAIAVRNEQTIRHVAGSADGASGSCPQPGQRSANAALSVTGDRGPLLGGNYPRVA